MPELQETEVASAHWIPLELLHSPTARYGTVDIDIASRLAPKNRVARTALKMLVGQMSFKYVFFQAPRVPIPISWGFHVSDLQMYSPAERPCLASTGCASRRQTSRSTTLGIDTRSVIAGPCPLSSPHLPTLASRRTVGMTLDLLSHMTLSRSASDLSTYPYAVSALDRPVDGSIKEDKSEGFSPFASPSEASIFPRFVSPPFQKGLLTSRLSAPRSLAAP